MHPQAYEFVRQQAALASASGLGLDIGAYDVNGNCRSLFPDVRWHGIDIRPGPNVDEVVDAAFWDPPHVFRIVLCTETLEHCEEPRRVVECAADALLPGGIFIMTCACPDRPPHDNNGDRPPFTDHYRNIDPYEYARWLKSDFVNIFIEEHPDRGDLYSVAWKKPSLSTR